MEYTLDQIEVLERLGDLADEQRLQGNLEEWKLLEFTRRNQARIFEDENNRKIYFANQKELNELQRSTLHFLMNYDMKSIFDGVFRVDSLMGYIDLSQFLLDAPSMQRLAEVGTFDVILHTEMHDTSLKLYRWNEILPALSLGMRRYKVMRNGDLELYQSNDDSGD